MAVNSGEAIAGSVLVTGDTFSLDPARCLGTSSGAPSGGTYEAGDWSLDYTTPGIWLYNGSSFRNVVSSGGVTSLAINSHTPLTGGVTMNVTRQPIAQPSGIPQPLPPALGMAFGSTLIHFNTGLGNAELSFIVPGPDGNLWCSDYFSGHGVWKVTPAGVVTQYAMTSAQTYGICAGPDGNLWVADYTTGHGVWKVTPAGVRTNYTIAGATVGGICAGPDGNLWASGNGYVWKVTPAGVVTPYAMAGMNSVGIGAGPDGNLWVADQNSAIWKVTPEGVGTKYQLALGIIGVCTGPDSNLWCGVLVANEVYRISPTTGALIGSAISITNEPNYICAGPDGNLWVAQGAAICSINPLTLAVTNYSGPADSCGMCIGPDGNLWVADQGGSAGVWVLPAKLIFGDLAPDHVSGTTGQVLTVQANGSAAWAAATGFANPMTTAGDLIVGGASGVPGRLGVGTAYQQLGINASSGVVWQTSPTSVFTTTGQLLYCSSARNLAALGIGSTGQALVVSGGLPAWGQPSLLPGGNTISSPVTLTATTAVNMLTTPSLAIGTWEVTFSGLVTAPAAALATGLEMYPSGGTATYSITGPAASELPYQAGSADIPFQISFTVVVTVAGTVILVGYNNSGSNATLQSSTQGTSAKAGVSGTTVKRLA